MCRLSKIDVSPFEDRCHDMSTSEIDVSTFEDRCVDLRRWMCWCVDLRRSIVDVSTFEHVKLGCYTCSKYWYYSCMRITPSVCTSVLSFFSNCGPRGMCNIRGNFAIIIFSKLRDGTSGNLLYISGYQSQFYRISMKIRQCAQNISARLSQWYLKLYMTRVTKKWCKENNSARSRTIIFFTPFFYTYSMYVRRCILRVACKK